MGDARGRILWGKWQNKCDLTLGGSLVCLGEGPAGEGRGTGKGDSEPEEGADMGC